ncbi:MAG TPA: asparagine synthase (glutamine-hydrolyzing) [Solirubrobacterales bacterium]|nr:asparagine synthase (glutamine-hydrolyzing) [Solirubrobacterales bacterium]
MCGICGIAALHPDADIDDVRLGRMREALQHRGPDDAGTHLARGVGLAMRRLAIIDLEAGRQPMYDESGSVAVVQNGEIYNFASLRQELVERGHRLETHSDTEVIPHLYEDEGPLFVRRLRGMFAIALWDEKRRRLLLARDRYGIKPLLYSERDGLINFSSELTSLLESGEVDRTVDPDSLGAYLRFNWIPGEETIFAGVKSLPPGHLLIAEDGKTRIEQFAEPADGAPAEASGSSAEEASAELLRRLRESVTAHLVADVPVGVLLSGGVDSAMLAALASEQVSRVKTFSIGFEDPRFNELPRARLVAERYGTDHHELVVDPDVTALMPRLIEAFDQPLGDSSTVPSFLVSELAAAHVKVALAGEGGDEMFAGYNSYAADRLGRRIGHLAALGRPLVERVPDGRTRYPDRAKRFVRGAALPPVARHCSWLEVFSQEQIESLMLRPPSNRKVASEGFFADRYGRSSDRNWLTRLQDLDVGGYLVDDLLMKTDLASMAHSLEIRVPYLDAAIADFAYDLAPNQKLRGTKKKWLLRKAAERLLPIEILKAPKQGFSIPAATWLREDLREYATDALSAETLSRQGFFDPGAVEALYREHLEMREDHSRRLWGLLMFTLWAERFQARAR